MKDEGKAPGPRRFSSFILTPSSLPFRGALWMVVAGLLFSLMGVFVKLGAQQFSTAELVFYRSLFGLAAIYAIVRLRGGSVRSRNWRLHLWRGLSGFTALMLFFHALSHLPLGMAMTLNYTSPLFLVLMTVLVLGERPHWRLIAAILVGFLGVALLLRPSFEAGQLETGLLGLASGFFAGIAYLNVKELGRVGEPEWRVVFYFTLISSLGGGAWMTLHPFHAVTWNNIGLLAALGGTATLAQLAMTRAYAVGHTLTVASLAYSAVVFSALLGIAVWGEVPSATGWLGMGIVILAGVIGVRFTPRAAPGVEGR